MENGVNILLFDMRNFIEFFDNNLYHINMRNYHTPIKTDRMLKSGTKKLQEQDDHWVIDAIIEMAMFEELRDKRDPNSAGGFGLKNGLPIVYYIVNFIRGKMKRAFDHTESREPGGYLKYKKLKLYETRLCEVFRVDHISKISRYNIKRAMKEEVLQEYDELRKYEESHIADVKVKKDRLFQVLRPQIEHALEYALKNVDLSRSNREIVAYIVRAFRDQLWQKQLKDSGRKRVMRKSNTKINGESYHKNYYAIAEKSYVQPRFMITEEYTHQLLGTKVDIELLAEILNKNQCELIYDIVELFEKDQEAGNISNYRLDLDGLTIPNYRYISRELGIEESNLKHKIRRIRDRINKKS